MKFRRTLRTPAWAVLTLAVLTFCSLLRGEPVEIEILPGANEFQNAVLDLTRDLSTDGRRAIDLYWEARGMPGLNAREPKLPFSVGDLWLQLGGDRICNLRLTPSGWAPLLKLKPLVLTPGQTDQLWLVMTNGTVRTRKFILTGLNTILEVEPQSFVLPPQSTTAARVKLTPRRAGKLEMSLQLNSEGQLATIPILGQVKESGEVSVRIRDAGGHLTPARIYLTGADGLYHAPPGALDRVMWMSGEHYFYSNGSFTLPLPEGEASIEAVKGFDNHPLRARIWVQKGKTTLLNLQFEPLLGMNAQGWYCGDGHVHGNYVQDETATPTDDLLVARAEGLNLANMVVSNSTGSAVYDEVYFQGKPDSVSLPDCILQWNQEMRTHGPYGHLLFFGLRQLVRPIYTGFPGTVNWEDYPSNYLQAQKARDAGGYVSYAHPSLTFDTFPWGASAGEAVVDVPLGVIDALEVFCSQEETSARLWYRFLNLGFRLGITAGSDAESLNQRFSFVAGGDRLYVHTHDGFSYAEWLRGLRRGEVFATQGPLLLFQIEGKNPGADFQSAGGPLTLHAQAKAVSYIPISKLEIIANGEVVGEVSSAAPTDRLEWKGALHFDRSAWLAARVWGPENRLIANGPSRWEERRSTLVLLAHTGPSYVKIGNTVMFSERERQYMLEWTDALVDKVEKTCHFANAAHREEVLAICHRAHHYYATLLGLRGR